MLKLIKAILSKNENAAYSALANVRWNKEPKICHYKDESGLSYGMHAVQSIACGWFFLKLALFCFIWHPLFPNIGPHWATEKLAKWDDWYKTLNRKLKVCIWKTRKEVENLNPFSQML